MSLKSDGNGRIGADSVISDQSYGTERNGLCVKHNPSVRSDHKTDHRAKIRALLSKYDPAMLAFCDAAKERFDAKLTGLQIQTELGTVALGELGPEKPAESKP